MHNIGVYKKGMYYVRTKLCKTVPCDNKILNSYIIIKPAYKDSILAHSLHFIDKFPFTEGSQVVFVLLCNCLHQ